MEGRSRNGHPFPWFHRCRNHDQLKFPNPNFENGLAQRVIINGLFPSENRRVQRIPMSPPPTMLTRILKVDSPNGSRLPGIFPRR
jgi:hypothetical protein